MELSPELHRGRAQRAMRRELYQRRVRGYIPELVQDPNRPTPTEPERLPHSMFSHHFSRFRDGVHGSLLTSTAEERVEGAELSKLFSPESEITQTFQAIAKDMSRALKEAKTPEERTIYTQQEPWKQRIDAWVTAAIHEVRVHARIPLDEELLEREARASFDALAAMLNTRVVTREVELFAKEFKTELGSEARRERVIALFKEHLHKKFSYSDVEVDGLVSICIPEPVQGPKGNEDDDDDDGENPTIDSVRLKELVGVINRLWNEYGLKEQKGVFGQLALGTLTDAALRGVFPGLEKKFVKEGKFQLDTYLARILGRLGESATKATMKNLEDEIILGVKNQLTGRMVDSIMFRRLEFGMTSTQDTSRIMGQGMRAIEELIGKIFGSLIPSFTQIAASVYALSRMHPVMGVTGVGSLPVLGYLSYVRDRRRHAEWKSFEKRERAMDEKMFRYKEGIEQSRVSEYAGEAATEIKAAKAAFDRHRTKTLTESLSREFTMTLPKDVIDIVSGCVGYALQEMGVIKDGDDVLRQIKLIGDLRQPVMNLVNVFETDLRKSLERIHLMEELFGNKNEIDLPDGPLERRRLPFSALPTRDITIDNLYFRDPVRNVDVLQGATETIREGEFVLLVGESGAGKSMILRHLADLHAPEYGEVRIGGIPVQEIKKYGPDSLYASMAYADQAPVLFLDLSVRENLTMWNPVLRDNDRELIRVLTELGLDKFTKELDKPLVRVSGGETLRFGLARALLKKPKILLLDEPTASLDPGRTRETWQVLREMHQRDPKLTVVCVTHNESLIAQFEENANDPRIRIVTVEKAGE